MKANRNPDSYHLLALSLLSGICPHVNTMQGHQT